MFENIRKILIDLYDKHGRGMFNILKSRNYKSIFDNIYILTDDMCRGKDISFNTRCYLLYNDMKDFPKCENKNCNNLIIENINSFSTGFHRYCSTKCLSNDKRTKERIARTKTEKYGDPAFNNYTKTKKTNMERYGVEHTFQTENNKIKSKKTKIERYGDANFTNQEKRDKTNIERYGSKYLLDNKELKEKRKETMIERYGSEYSLQSEELKKKMEDTCEEKYGDRHYRDKEKAKKTKLERYGDVNYNNRELAKKTCMYKYGLDSYTKTGDYKEKIKSTSLEKYGVEYYIKTKEFQEKSKQTCIDKYGLEYFSKTTESRNVLSYRQNEYFYNRLNSCENIKPLFTLNDYLSCGGITVKHKWKCCRCNNIFDAVIDIDFAANHEYSSYVRCPECDKRIGGKSMEEIELYKFIKENYNGKIIFGKGGRKIIPPYEIDIYLPDKKLGIEYDGVFWHSEFNGFFNEDVMMKTLICDEINIKLIHIMSDEWKYSKENTKKFLSDLILNKNNDVDFIINDSNSYQCDVLLSSTELFPSVKSVYEFIKNKKKNDNRKYGYIFDRRKYSLREIEEFFNNITILPQNRQLFNFNDCIRYDSDRFDNINTKKTSAIWDCGKILVIS